MAFVQGFLAEVTLDGNVVTLVTADVTLDESRTVLDKSVMDSVGASTSIPGMKSGTLSINGHVDQANLNLLEISWGKEAPVAFLLEINEGLSTDASYAGFVTLDSFTKETAADGNWAFSIGGPTSGKVTFTASAP